MGGSESTEGGAADLIEGRAVSHAAKPRLSGARLIWRSGYGTRWKTSDEFPESSEPMSLTLAQPRALL